MNCCVIFGGAGFIGTHLAKHFLLTGRFQHVHLADIRPSPLESSPGITYSRTDVRQSIGVDLIPERPDWIFNLAAVHREPGHEPFEYFETNLAGAENVCSYAETTGCSNIYFTSSISVYGPAMEPTSEASSIRPTTPYGSSKYPAELIHESWRQAGRNRRLIISRPGVVYGPGDPGNIMRMIRAIRKGYFAFPGSPRIYKSYAYIYGLLDSVDFVMDRADPKIVYNYVETPTQPLNEVVHSVKKFLDRRAIVLPMPLWFLMPVSKLVQGIFGENNPIHPVRVRKAATPTHIVPQTLLSMGFRFKYDFLASLDHWREVAPEDFDFAARETVKTRLKLVRDGEQPPESTLSGRSTSEWQEVSKED